MHSQTYTLLVASVLLIMITTAQESSADNTPAPTLSTVLPKKMVSGGRGDPITLNFRKLFPDIPPMVAVISVAPKNGALYKQDGITPINPETMSTVNNIMVYRSNSDFPANGQKQGIETIEYRLQSDEGSYKGAIDIVVNNRGLVIHDYNLRAVDDSTPLMLTLNVRDGREKLTLESPLLSKVTVDTLPKGGCTVQQFDRTTMTEEPTAITDKLFRIWIIPESGSPDGSKCTFKYSATRRNGVQTLPATVTVTRMAARAPRAYDTRVVYQVDFDISRTVELIGISGNPGRNLTFVLNTIPTIGQLFDVAESSNDELPSKGIEASDLPLKLYTGRKSRVALIYKIMNPDRLKGTKLSPVFATFTVMDGLQTSRTATVTINLVRSESPVCGDSVISPVFWDQPAKNVVLNYTVPNGLRVQRVILLSTPAKPIGDLTYFMQVDEKPSQRQTLRMGSIFNDNYKRLQYLVRRQNMRASGRDTFKFRVQTFNGLSCVGSVTFVVMQHDARRPPAGVSVRRELVRVNSITLLPMWGQANTSVAPVSIRITSAPTRGQIFRVSSETKYEPGLMYRVARRGEQTTYCHRHDCQKLLDGEIRVGDSVQRQELFSSNSLLSDTRIWVFYKSPKLASFNGITDSFEYVFVDQNGKQSTPQRVEIYYRKALKRVINIQYTMADVRRNQNFDHQAETRIICVLSNATNQRVMIPEFDKYRRHGQREEFRLFQYRKDGNRVYNGERLANAMVGGVVGQWLESENTVILIPAARARKQRFQFRAVIYNTSADGQLMAETREEVRVLVSRVNTVPEWVFEYITGKGKTDVYVGSMTPIDIAAYDEEDDLLAFRIGEGVKHGFLFYERLAFGVRTMDQIKTGSIIRIPKGSFQRSDIRLQYLTNGAADWTFPRYDNFSIYADDGGGVLSVPLFYNISIVGDRSGRVVTTHTYEISMAFVGVAVTLAVGAVVVMIVLLKRRLSRRRYTQVPQDVELN